MAYDDTGVLESGVVLKVDAEITLDAEMIKKIVSKYITENYGHAVTEIRFGIDPGYNDRMDYKAPSLKNATVKVKL